MPSWPSLPISTFHLFHKGVESYSTRVTGDIMVTKIGEFFYFCETDSLGGETDSKSTMYASCDENPVRCFGREALIALRKLSSCAILVRASGKALKGSEVSVCMVGP